MGLTSAARLQRTYEVPMTDANVASFSMLSIPVRYHASMETIGEHEAKTIQGLIETMEGRLRTLQ
jgi:hypothetical protein